MIRVMQIVHRLSMGGAEKLVYQYGKKINKEKFEVYILCIENCHSIYDEDLKNENIKIIYINDEIDKIINVGGVFQRVIRKLFRKYFFVKCVKKVQPDIIHTHIFMNSLLKGINLSKNTVIFNTVHSDPDRYWFELGRNGKRDLKALMWIRDKYKLQIIALHHDSKDRINQILEVTNTQVLNNGVEIKWLKQTKDKNTLKKEYAIQDRIIIGHVGRLSEVKNQKLLIKAYANIVDLIPDSKLWIIGDGDLLEDLKSLVDKLDIKEHVVFWGNRSDVYNLVKMMDLFVMPSYKEGISLAMIECQVLETPMLISDTISNYAIISNLVEMYDINKSEQLWGNKIVELVNRKKSVPEYYNLEEWDINYNVKQLEKLYEEVIADGCY